MNVGILTEGAFSAFQSSDWRTRLAILLNGAFTPFVVVGEVVLIIGIRDKGTGIITDKSFIMIGAENTSLVSHYGHTKISDKEKELIESTEFGDIYDKNIEVN
jgi:hypothetical protein